MVATLERIQGNAKGEREFDALERERLKTDQVTEASERLNGVMENVFDYAYHDGDLYFQEQSLAQIFNDGIRAAEEIVKLRPEFMVELQRRHIERQQLAEQIELIQYVDWQNPLVLVHISPIPDAVLNDGVDLNAYDKERKKIMVRITEPTPDGVKVTSMSLDGNDRVALQAVGDFFGVDIPDDASSEDILGIHFLAEQSQFSSERPAKVLRERYDNALKMQYGGEWYAGRRNSDVLNTMQKILAYPELVEQHVDEVLRIKKHLGKNFRFTAEYDRATYDFLAAIEESNRVGSAVKSMSAAGGAARSSGVTYAKSDCPTSGTITTAEQALEAQGIIGKRWMSCGVCHKSNACYGDPCATDRLTCIFCHSYAEAGAVVDMRGSHVNADSVSLQEGARTNTEENKTTGDTQRNAEAEFRAIIEREFGEGAFVKEFVEVGGTRTDVLGRGGRVLSTGVNLGVIALKK